MTRAVVLDSLAAVGARWQMVCTSSSHAGCIAAARGGLGLTVRSHSLAGRGLSPPVNRAALPELPKVEFIALGAKHLSRPAETLLEILQNTDLRGEWARRVGQHHSDRRAHHRDGCGSGGAEVWSGGGDVA